MRVLKAMFGVLLLAPITGLVAGFVIATAYAQMAITGNTGPTKWIDRTSKHVTKKCDGLLNWVCKRKAPHA